MDTLFYLRYIFCKQLISNDLFAVCVLWIEMNLSEFTDEDNATSEPFDVTVTEHPHDYGFRERSDATRTVDSVMAYVCLALGVPGNILSAIIWLRRHVISKNSSALYLAVLAISDIVYLLIESFLQNAFPSIFSYRFWYITQYIDIIRATTQILEPLLVLSFSVERLIAISFPLQVRCIRLRSKQNKKLSYRRETARQVHMST